MDSETIVVSRAEYDALLKLKEEHEKLKEDLPALIAQAKLDRDRENLEKLHDRDRENPEQHRERSKRLYNLKKDEILAKRREAYRIKKQGKQE